VLNELTPNPTIDEQVYARVRQAILEGQLEPGQDLVISTLAQQLGVSRIPVMRACHRLVGEGFLLANPRRSLTVVALSEERMAETVEVLLALECLALEHAALEATPAFIGRLHAQNMEVQQFRRPPGSLVVNTADYGFHDLIWQAANRPYLREQIKMVYDHHEPARALSRRLHQPAQSAGEHEEVIRALERHDAAAAQDALRRHRSRALQRAITALRQKQEEREHVTTHTT
jgi:DNA-binding GntR family transcriptional regulator